ncbi:MAG: hypothetical protein ACFHWX_14990 [Bacteroidota bacterium]
MITETMNIQEVNREIIRIFPELMRIILSKSKHRERQSRKKGYPDDSSSYEIDGVIFTVFYFEYEGYDVNRIFCRYRDNIGPIYAYVSSPKPGKYSILHFLKHALEQYNNRLDLQLIQTKDILFHMSKYGLTMVRQEVSKLNDNLQKVFWVSNIGLWLGESGNTFKDLNTHLNLVRTFIDVSLKRDDQEAILDDVALERLLVFEKTLGDDEYARRMVNQLIELFKRK